MLAACEATLTLQKTSEQEVNQKQELLTMQEMRDRKFSQRLYHDSAYFPKLVLYPPDLMV